MEDILGELGGGGENGFEGRFVHTINLWAKIHSNF